MIDEPTRYQLAEYAQSVREVGELKAERDRLRQRIALCDKMEDALSRAISRCPCGEYGCNQCDKDRAVLTEAQRLKGGDK